MKRANASSGGMFSGADFRNAGGGRAALPGTAWLSRQAVAKPTPAPVAPVKPVAPQAPAQPSAGSSFIKSPQFFGAMAGALKPVTQAVLGYGGLPALAGLYGMFSGSKDWSAAMEQNPTAPAPRMNNQSPPTNYAPDTVPQQPMANAQRLPLPVKSANGRLAMPERIKAAGSPIAQSPGPGWGSGALSAGPIASGSEQGPDINRFLHLSQQAGGGGEAGSTPSIVPHVLQNIAQNTALTVAAKRGIEAGATKIGPRLGLQAATKIPGLKGGLLFDTPINIGTDALDAAGIYSMDGSKDQAGNAHFWRKPLKDEQGQLQRDEYGDVRTEAGWNPNAFGWDMDEHQRATTPDGNIAFGMRTGNDAIDYPASYGTSALRAYSNPLKSTYSLGKFQWWDMNPLRAAVDSEEREGIRRNLAGKPLNGLDTTIPTLAANTVGVTKPWNPSQAFMPGGKSFEPEAARWKQQNRYHPIYNPEGQTNRPWFGARMMDQLLN